MRLFGKSSAALEVQNYLIKLAPIPVGQGLMPERGNMLKGEER